MSFFLERYDTKIQMRKINKNILNRYEALKDTFGQQAKESNQNRDWKGL